MNAGLPTRLVRLATDKSHKTPARSGLRCSPTTPHEKRFIVKNTTKYTAALAAFGVAASLIAIAPAAYAEPVADGYVVVGSDTLQDVLNGLANGSKVTDTEVRVSGMGVSLTSFDAIGSATIKAKPYGPTFGRPNGSGDGRKALSRSIDGAPYTAATPGSPTNVPILGQVDIARSSSSGTQNPNGVLLQIPFGRDGLTYAHNGTHPAFDNIDAGTLKGIFEGTITELAPGVPVVGVIPQAGSGTRADFLKLIDVKDADLASTVKVGQEHDTRKLQNGDPMPANSVTPQSAGQWVAASTGAGSDRRGAGFKLGSPIPGTPAVDGEGQNMLPNAVFFASNWGRDSYIVVENARVVPGDAKYDAKLAALVGTGQLANRSSLPASVGAVKAKYGFTPAAATAATRITGS